MITITFGAIALMLAATASLSACLGLMIGCLLRAASDKLGGRNDKRRPK